MYALIHTDYSPILGISKVDLIQNTNLFHFDIQNGELYFRKEKDTISYHSSYTPEEMMLEMSNRAIELLKRNGWTLFKEVI